MYSINLAFSTAVLTRPEVIGGVYSTSDERCGLDRQAMINVGQPVARLRPSVRY